MSDASTAQSPDGDPILNLPLRPKPLRIALYLLTLLSAVAALFLEPALAGAVSRGAISPHWLFTAIGIYGVFFLAYAVDRLLLVRKRRYPTGKAFFQIAFGLVFGLLLLPSTIGDYATRAPRGLVRLLDHPDPEVRAVAVEAIGFRGPSREYISLILPKLKDRDPGVERAARQVLGRWSNKSSDDAAGIAAWASALSGTATVGAPSLPKEESR